MKRLGLIFTFMVLFFTSLPLLAQSIPVLPPATDDQVFQGLMALLGGYKGMSAIAVTAAILQILYKLAASPMFGNVLDKMNGDAKFVLINMISIGGVFSAQLSLGQSWMPALLNSGVAMLIMNFLYQAYERFVKKPA